MADKDMTARKEATLYNTADGPRSVIDADGNARVVGPGDSVTADFTAGELGSLHPDLSTSKPKDAPEAPSESPSTPSDQTADEQAHAIEELATTLQNGNTRDELLAMADAEKVAIETDDNKAQLALKIAQARLGENK